MSNIFQQYGALSDDEDDAPKTAAPVSTGSKSGSKSRRRRKKRRGGHGHAHAATNGSAGASNGDAAGGLGNPGNAVAGVVARCVAAGFSQRRVTAMVDVMFSNGDAYDDFDAVIAALVGQQAKQSAQAGGASTAAPAPAPAPAPARASAAVPAAAPAPAPAAPRTQADDWQDSGARGRGAKKGGDTGSNGGAAAPAPAPAPAAAVAAGNGAGGGAGAGAGAGLNGGSAGDTASSAGASTSTGGEDTADDAEQAAVLLSAAKMPDIKPVLVSLCRWRERTSEAKKVDLIFSSGALAALFLNLLQTLPDASVDDQLSRLLVGLLPGTRSQEMAAEVTNTIRAAINTLRNLGVADSDTDDYRTAHATALESFASSVASRVAGVFRAASADVAAAADLGGRGRELRDLERRLAATRGHDAKAQFRRRDCAFAIAKAHCANVAALRRLGLGGGDSAEADGASGDSDSALQSALAALAPPEVAGARERVAEVKQALNEIRQGYEAEIAPLVEEERAVAAEMDQLRAKKQALLKEVEALNKDIAARSSRRKELAATRDSLAARHHDRATALTKEDAGLATAVYRADAPRELGSAYTTLATKLRSLSRVSAAERSAGAAGSFARTRATLVRALASHCRCEADCVAFLRTRTMAAQHKLKSSETQLSAMRTVRNPKESVIAILSKTITEAKDSIAADKGALEHLVSSTESLLANASQFVGEGADPPLSDADKRELAAVRALAKDIVQGTGVAAGVPPGGSAAAARRTGSKAGSSSRAAAAATSTASGASSSSSASSSSAPTGAGGASGSVGTGRGQRPRAGVVPAAAAGASAARRGPARPSGAALKPKPGGNPWGKPAATTSTAPSMFDIIAQEARGETRPSPAGAGAGAGAGATATETNDAEGSELEEGEIREDTAEAAAQSDSDSDSS